MSKENLQTIIVSKRLAKTRRQAERLARPYAKKIYTSRETESSWRFRQRPPTDFVRKSFRSFPLPQEEGIVLVYGNLKRERNPSQKFFQWRGSHGQEDLLREWDFWMTIQPRINRSRSANGLTKLAQEIQDRNIQSVNIRDLALNAIAERARVIGMTSLRSSIHNNERIFRSLLERRIQNPTTAKRLKTKKTRAKKASKKSTSKATKKAPSYIKLKPPKTMPSPGPCAWLGSMVEWAWQMDNGETSKLIDENGNAIWEPKSEWMFMWSPKYKAVVAIKRPEDMYKLAKVSRHGGAAKMFETFMARPAENTFELKVPAPKLHRMGVKAAHIVYRSDKWSPKRLDTDYIHDFGKGVQIYCGPNIKKPEVFLCYGGKLTLTKRGLVY